MPALAPITIQDGAATPANHTFSPVTTDGWLARLSERVGVPVGYPSLGVSVREPAKGGSVYRNKITIAVPVTAVVDGVTVVDYTNQVSVEFLLSQKGTEQNRKDLRMLLVNALQHASITPTIDKLEPVY